MQLTLIENIIRVAKFQKSVLVTEAQIQIKNKNHI